MGRSSARGLHTLVEVRSLSHTGRAPPSYIDRCRIELQKYGQGQLVVPVRHYGYLEACFDLFEHGL